MSGFEHNLSHSRLHDRSKSNVNYNRHFQIKHEPSHLNSLATFQKLINNFDIKCESTDNVIAEDRESIDRKASELKKYMSSGISHAQRLNLSKSSRENREISYGQDKIFETSLNYPFSESKLCKKDNNMFYKTSFISQNEIRVNKSKHSDKFPGVKIASYQLNEAFPLTRLNQVADTPSIEFDIND